MYYEDSLAWAIFLADVQRNSSKKCIKPMNTFYNDVANGTLANFIFLEPRIAPSKNVCLKNYYKLFSLIFYNLFVSRSLDLDLALYNIYILYVLVHLSLTDII